MKIYLAGPMRGYPKFNFPNFFEVTKKLRKEGFVVFNPAERDIQHYGNLKNVTKSYKKNPAKVKRDVIKKDLNWIIKHADIIALLPGWKKSKGVAVELALAEFLGIEVWVLGKPYVK